MGDVIYISEYLERKYYARYAWAYERVRFIPLFSDTYDLDLEDGHGYRLMTELEAA